MKKRDMGKGKGSKMAFCKSKTGTKGLRLPKKLQQ